MSLGANLSEYKHLNFLSATTEEELRFLLSQIRLPHKVMNIYHDGKNHVAWVNLDRPLNKDRIMSLKEFKKKMGGN